MEVVMKCYTIQHSKTTDKEWEKYLEAYKNSYVAMQYEYNIQDNRIVSERWNCFIKIKEGDILFLQNQLKIYAWGYAIKPRLKNKKRATVSPISLSAKSIVKNYNHGKYRSDKNSAYIIFSDCEVFYENLEDGNEGWGQRIDVDKWEDYRKDGISYIPVAGRSIIKETTQAQAEKYIRKLSGNKNFKI